VIVASLLAALALAPSTTVGMSAREFRFGVYREAVPAGTTTLVMHNFGEDDHDVQVLGPHGYHSAISPDADPGATVRLTVHLRHPGRYQLICTKPGHLAKGMRAILRVR
jgi:uncharacterized cupredoxin-like copper-binding protein